VTLTTLFQLAQRFKKSGQLHPLKNAYLKDVTPCGSCKNRRFRGTYDRGAKFLRNVGSYKSHMA
jgi:hypothetical protein